MAMTPEVERKVAAILLALDGRPANNGDIDLDEVRNILDSPDVAAWLTECRRKGHGDANVFTMGRQ